jgi:hypothetical protein
MLKGLRFVTLAALAALMAMALVGASSAMATSTALCKADESPCAEGNIITHVHEVSVGHAKLLSSFATVECEVLFLGDALNSGVGTPLTIHGTFTYTCLNACTAEEENGPSEIHVLKTGTELAEVTGEGLVHVVCGLNCRYNGVGLKGHGLGPLLVGSGNGRVTISGATVNKESGTFCPSTSKLDIKTAPLPNTYIRTMKCFETTPEKTGLYENIGNGVTCTGDNAKKEGNYELGYLP